MSFRPCDIEAPALFLVLPIISIAAPYAAPAAVDHPKPPGRRGVSFIFVVVMILPCNQFRLVVSNFWRNGEVAVVQYLFWALIFPGILGIH